MQNQANAYESNKSKVRCKHKLCDSKLECGSAQDNSWLRRLDPDIYATWETMEVLYHEVDLPFSLTVYLTHPQ